MVKKNEVSMSNRIGCSFYDGNLPTAFSAVLAYAAEISGVVASMPTHLHLRRKVSFKHSLWNTWYTCNSEEDVGKTAQGTKVVLEAHNGAGPLTWRHGPERITTAYERGLTKQYAAHLTDKEIKLLLAGKFPDGTDGVQVFENVKEFSSATDTFEKCADLLLKPYAVILDFDAAKATESGYQDIQRLRDNPLVHVRAGGVAVAHAFIDYAAQRYSNYGNWHPFNVINPAETQGRVLFVGYGDGNGLGGSGNLNLNGQFLGVRAEQSSAVHGITDSVVAPEALVPRAPQETIEASNRKSAPLSLEARASEGVDHVILAALEAGNAFEHNGMLYVPTPAKNVKLQK